MSRFYYVIWLVEGKREEEVKWSLYQVFRTRREAQNWKNANCDAPELYRIKKAEVDCP